MRIALIGFMGAGKTTIAKILAEQLELSLYECDEEVEKLTDTTIANLIDQKGEEHFRTIETEVLKTACSMKNIVVSPGGGIVQKPDNIELLNQYKFIVVYLETSFEVIKERIAGCKTRPLFRDEQQAFNLYLKRKKLYEQAAKFKVNTDSSQPGEIVSEILNVLGALRGVPS